MIRCQGSGKAYQAFAAPRRDEDHPGICFLSRGRTSRANDCRPVDSCNCGGTRNSDQRPVLESPTQFGIGRVGGHFGRARRARGDSLSLLLGVAAVFSRTRLPGPDSKYRSIRLGHLHPLVAPRHEIASSFQDAGREPAAIGDTLRARLGKSAASEHPGRSRAARVSQPKPAKPTSRCAGKTRRISAPVEVSQRFFRVVGQR